MVNKVELEKVEMSNATDAITIALKKIAPTPA